MIIEPGSIGGILLIMGAYALYRGSLVWSVGLYFVADIMWVWLSFLRGDVFGTITISIGMLLGLLVFLKSHRGEFVKDLHTKPKEE